MSDHYILEVGDGLSFVSSSSTLSFVTSMARVVPFRFGTGPTPLVFAGCPVIMAGLPAIMLSHPFAPCWRSATVAGRAGAGWGPCPSLIAAFRTWKEIKIPTGDRGGPRAPTAVTRPGVVTPSMIAVIRTWIWRPFLLVGGAWRLPSPFAPLVIGFRQRTFTMFLPLPTDFSHIPNRICAVDIFVHVSYTRRGFPPFVPPSLLPSVLRRGGRTWEFAIQVISTPRATVRALSLTGRAALGTKGGSRLLPFGRGVDWPGLAE